MLYYTVLYLYTILYNTFSVYCISGSSDLLTKCVLYKMGGAARPGPTTFTFSLTNSPRERRSRLHPPNAFSFTKGETHSGAVTTPNIPQYHPLKLTSLSSLHFSVTTSTTRTPNQTQQRCSRKTGSIRGLSLQLSSL